MDGIRTLNQQARTTPAGWVRRTDGAARTCVIETGLNLPSGLACETAQDKKVRKACLSGRSV